LDACAASISRSAYPSVVTVLLPRCNHRGMRPHGRIAWLIRIEARLSIDNSGLL
jgi:hypothetical protein